MGVKNYLIDGVSCAGKSTVCAALQRCGASGPTVNSVFVFSNGQAIERWHSVGSTHASIA